MIGGPKPSSSGKSAAEEIVKRATEAAKAAAAAGGASAPAKGHVMIALYENGFTVKMGEEAEGDLRTYEAPENKEFMDSINAGRVPKELTSLPQVRSGDLDVGISDKRSEKYTAPPYKAYSGTGATVGKSAVPASAIVRGSGSGAKAVVVDPGAPTTRLRVKLLNGKMETLTLNLTHTIGDLQHMVAALNGSNGKPFLLLGGFPPKPLEVVAATIEASGLKNASITQQAA